VKALNLKNHSAGHLHMKPDRITQFDGLRAIAIVAVFLHHAYHAKMLWMGVDLFFVLSGFLITGILVKQKETLSLGAYIGRFYARRGKRILPAYCASLVVTAIVFGIGWLSHWYLYLGAMNFIQPFKIDSPTTLQPLWSLAVEEQFYLAWPFAVYFLSRRQLVWLSAGLIVAAPILRYVCTPLFPTPWAVYTLLPFRMDCLAAGALLLLMKDKLAPARPWYGWLGAVPVSMGLLYLIVLGKQGYSKGGNAPYGNFAIYEATLLISVFVFWMAWVGIGKRILSSWPLVWLGTISLSLYLIHPTLLYVTPFRSVILAAVLSIAYASIMWIAVESPILHGSFRAAPSPKQEEASVAEAV
jgi:peptidoglycan/LPS O-acetylase OafA/YrhL